MIASMTAFARQESEGEWGRAVWEVRSVNHRYLEISLRMPENLRHLETKVRELVGKRLNRGKVDCSLRFETITRAGETLSINQDLARQISAACKEISPLLANPAPVNPLDVLRWPGVIVEKATDPEAINTPILDLLNSSLDTLIEARQREGAKLSDIIQQRCSASIEQVDKLRVIYPEILAAYRERLLEKTRELSTALSEDRLEQEMLLLAQKLDVAEELDRLDTHLHEMERVLKDKKPVGRRLDFLLQEMNREANTIGSKSTHTEGTNTSVELKVLIEQMREQIQNIE
jgi:uncharacterized protein (TIGR00255 family)